MVLWPWNNASALWHHQSVVSIDVCLYLMTLIMESQWEGKLWSWRLVFWNRLLLHNEVENRNRNPSVHSFLTCSLKLLWLWTIECHWHWYLSQTLEKSRNKKVFFTKYYTLGCLYLLYEFIVNCYRKDDVDKRWFWDLNDTEKGLSHFSQTWLF